MKVSPLSPPTATAEQNDVTRHDGSMDAINDCSGLKRRRLHSPANIIINNHYRHRKHLYPRHDGKSSSTDRFGAVDNSANSNDVNSCANSGEDASDCDESSTIPDGYPVQQRPADGGTSSPASHRRHDKKDQQTAVINNNNYKNDEECTTQTIRTTSINDNQITLSLSTQSVKNNESETNKTTHEPTMSSSPVKQPIKISIINEKYPSIADTDITVTSNDCINSETSNDDCLSQSPLNLTRSQGSSEESGHKSEDDDEGEYDDDNQEKNDFGNVSNEDENIVNGHNLPIDAPFPWNVSMGNNNKQKHQDDKITAPPPQLLLTSGQLTTGCLQAAQLLIPTARGIMTQTILAIPINDMVSSAITASNSNQQHLYNSSNNARQKNINRQQPNQTCQPPFSLPLSHFFQNQTTTDGTTTITCTPDNVNNDNNNYNASMNNDGIISTDQYNNIQRRKWQSPDLNSKKSNFISPQQKQLLRTKNPDGGESMNVQCSKESSIIQTPAGTNGDSRVYSNNNATSTTTSSPTLKRDSHTNGSGVDQRQTSWPTGVITDQHDDENDIEEDQPTHCITTPTSPVNINTINSLVQPPSSQLNCHTKQPKVDDSTGTSAAALASYTQQNAICTALATHMLCASQLAAVQQPMFDNMDNSNAVKKPNHVYNNNNNNIKTNNMMGVVNPAALEKWMMEERYYYNNNNNNNKNIAGSHTHQQRYNAAAAAAAAAVELLSVGVSGPSSGGVGDNLASCKKRKRRTSFTPHALELLNGHFERNTHPSGSEITGLAHRLGYEREVIRIWFCNKRQALKNTVRSINGSGPTHMTSTKSHNTY